MEYLRKADPSMVILRVDLVQKELNNLVLISNTWLLLQKKAYDAAMTSELSI